MAFFTIYNSGGEILRTGSCPDGEEPNQVNDGELLALAEAEPTDRINPATGAVVRVTIEPPLPTMPPPQYVIDRGAAYPSIAEQLDMLWRAMGDGTLPKVNDFYDRLKAVKDAFPKTGDTPATIIYPVEPLQ